MSLLSQESSIFSLLPLFLWYWSLSLLRHSLSSFWRSLSLILVSLRQMLRWWRNKAWLRSAWEPVAGIRGFWWSGFSGFHRSHFLLSFSFTGLLSFTFSFTPRGKPWDFGFGSEQKSKEMKMAGTMTAEKGWPERGFVEVWWVWGCGLVEDGRSEHGGGWLWVCGGGGLWVWDYGGGAVLWVCFRRKRRR